MHKRADYTDYQSAQLPRQSCKLPFDRFRFIGSRRSPSNRKSISSRSRLQSAESYASEPGDN